MVLPIIAYYEAKDNYYHFIQDNFMIPFECLGCGVAYTERSSRGNSIHSKNKKNDGNSTNRQITKQCIIDFFVGDTFMYVELHILTWNGVIILIFFFLFPEWLSTSRHPLSCYLSYFSNISLNNASQPPISPHVRTKGWYSRYVFEVIMNPLELDSL